MKAYVFTILVLFMSGCSILTPTCREAVGPVELNVQGGMAGGSVLAQVGKGGEYRSYPAMDGVCVHK